MRILLRVRALWMVLRAWAAAGSWGRPAAEAGLTEAREALARHFLDQGMVGDLRHGLGTEIMHYDHAHEIWFLIRYPEKQCRHSGCTRSGDWRSFVFNPEHYHAVAYSKVFGDIRMNAKRERDRRQYRMVFGRLLFGGASNVFRPKATVVTLAPLLQGRTAELFGCDDIPGLAMIAPTAIDYEVWGLCRRGCSAKRRRRGKRCFRAIRMGSGSSRRGR